MFEIMRRESESCQELLHKLAFPCPHICTLLHNPQNDPHDHVLLASVTLSRILVWSGHKKQRFVVSFVDVNAGD
jgi:hypothetical protein